MKPVQIVLTLFIAFALARVVGRYRRQVMRVRELLFFVAIWSAALVIVWFPGAAQALARVVGIGRGADLVVYTALAVLFYLIFQINLALDRLAQGQTEIVRLLAIERAPELRDPASRETTTP